MITAYIEELGKEKTFETSKQAATFFADYYNKVSKRKGSYARRKYSEMANSLLEAANIVEVDKACAAIAEGVSELPPQIYYNAVALSVDTTGTNKENDEILQVSIVGSNRQILFNEFIKPTHTTSWEGAQMVNKISPAMVENARPISEYIGKINEIFENADLIMGYNVNFDLGFLYQNGISKIDYSKVHDVMIEYSEYKKEINEYGSYRWFKLKEAVSDFFGYGIGESECRIPFEKVTNVLDVHRAICEGI